MNKYREFVDLEYTKFRKGLLRRKGGIRQEVFLQSALDSDGFVESLSQTVGLCGSAEVQLLDNPLTESEFATPPSDTEAGLYRLWSDLEPRTACRTTFWAHVTLTHVRNGRIKARYLATNGTGSARGGARIERVLDLSGDARAKEMDSCARTILRRLGGIPEDRGKRTVYVDCPFARAWWREWLVEQIAGADGDVARRVRAVVRINQTYWEKIVDRIVSRNSTFGSRNVRAAFVLGLAAVVDTNPASELRKPAALLRACRRVAAQQALRELAVLDDDELSMIMAEVLEPA